MSGISPVFRWIPLERCSLLVLGSWNAVRAEVTRMALGCTEASPSHHVGYTLYTPFMYIILWNIFFCTCIFTYIPYHTISYHNTTWIHTYLHTHIYIICTSDLFWLDELFVDFDIYIYVYIYPWVYLMIIVGLIVWLNFWFICWTSGVLSGKLWFNGSTWTNGYLRGVIDPWTSVGIQWTSIDIHWTYIGHHGPLVHLASIDMKTMHTWAACWMDGY